MLETRIFLLLSFYFVIIECVIPHLSVHKVDKKVVAQQRQDTLDMCRIFNDATEQLKYYQVPNKVEDVRKRRRSKIDVAENHRSKRDALNPVNPALNQEDIQRIENIVDKIYDDMEEKGAPVPYAKHPVGKAKLASNGPGRRFDFAPAQLLTFVDVGRPGAGDVVKENITKPARFPHGIVPYFIDSKTYDSVLSAVIISAFDYIERTTCIRLQRLRERPTDVHSLRNIIWVYISNPTGIRQCVHSNDHTAITGVQMVVIGYDCMSRGDIAHEVMHVLGFSHEHTRPDRDQHITILWDNIKPGYKKFFQLKNDSDVTHLPYDYESVLHYPSRAFSRNGQLTILTDPSRRVGQRERLSDLDVEKIGMVYATECAQRNREYLRSTCPTVLKVERTKKKVEVTKEEIKDYFKDRVWKWGTVEFKFRDRMEFTVEERDNINTVMRHIEEQTCIRFKDMTEESGKEKLAADSTSSDDNSEKDQKEEIDKFVKLASSENPNMEETVTEQKQRLNFAATEVPNADTVKDSDNEIKKSDDDNTNTLSENTNSKNDTTGTLKDARSRVRIKRSAVRASRRHSGEVIEITRTPDPGCACPKPGRPNGGNKVLKINTDCFNTVNDLVHLFVHVLGLDHQHNMYDRADYLNIQWDHLSDDLADEFQNKLPPAASVGISYDYQSVMHFPWLQIRDGKQNIMWPIWNDGWSMGHWQGLSTKDVQKLNIIYKDECQTRQKLLEEAI